MYQKLRFYRIVHTFRSSTRCVFFFLALLSLQCKRKRNKRNLFNLSLTFHLIESSWNREKTKTQNIYAFYAIGTGNDETRIYIHISITTCTFMLSREPAGVALCYFIPLLLPFSVPHFFSSLDLLVRYCVCFSLFYMISYFDYDFVSHCPQLRFFIVYIFFFLQLMYPHKCLIWDQYWTCSS